MYTRTYIHGALELHSTAENAGRLGYFNAMGRVEGVGKPHGPLLLGTDVSRGFVVSPLGVRALQERFLGTFYF